MTFQPALPLSGYSGWNFLKRTQARQAEVQQSLPASRRDEAYFREKIGKADTAEKLVSDRRLLRVALAAFGLEGDLNNKAFIRKVLEGGTLREGTLANKLADKQYQKFSVAFGYGDFSVPRTKISTFPDEILEMYRTRNFETAVGEKNNTYRLALNAEREIPAIASRTTTSETAKWYAILGSAPLRDVMQTALGLPNSFSAIDIDQQVATLRKKAAAVFGDETVSQFASPAKIEALTRQYLFRSEMRSQAAVNSPAAIALTLLRR